MLSQSGVYVYILLLLMSTALFPFINCYNGDPHSGIILTAAEKGIRSGVLSADHRCQDYPEKFPVSRINNPGTVHCTLWTEKKCQGSLFIIPAHYDMESPQGVSFKSVIC